MARQRRSASRRASGKSMRKPVDWVNTSEGWDVGVTGTLVTLDNTTPEVALPLNDAYGSFFDAITGPQFARSMPWPKRTVLRVRGWLHLFSPDYFVGTTEMMVVSQIERFQVDIDSGVAILPQEDLLDAAYSDVEVVYWKNQQHLYHNSTWTSPEDFNTFKRAIYIDRRMRVPLQEREVIVLHMQLTNFAASVTARVFVRPFIRVLVQMG